MAGDNKKAAPAATNKKAEETVAETKGTPTLPPPAKEGETVDTTIGQPQAETENTEALMAELKALKERNVKLEQDAENQRILAEKAQELAEHPKAKGGAEDDDKFVASLSEAKVRKVTVQFLQDHVFFVGATKYEAKKGETMEVELHVANKFAKRAIAFIKSK